MFRSNDYQKSGIVIVGTGLGLFLFGTINQDLEVLRGAGVLVGTIGISCFVTEYFFSTTKVNEFFKIFCFVKSPLGLLVARIRK